MLKILFTKSSASNTFLLLFWQERYKMYAKCSAKCKRCFYEIKTLVVFFLEKKTKKHQCSKFSLFFLHFAKQNVRKQSFCFICFLLCYNKTKFLFKFLFHLKTFRCMAALRQLCDRHYDPETMVAVHFV